MRVDYRSFLDKIWEAMPAEEYVAMASDPHVLGDPLLQTQHFIGSSKWEYVSESEAVGWHQLRVPHQRYKDGSRTEIAVKGHAHGSNQHWYRKIDGVWKFAGLAPIIRWGEFDFDSVFASGRDTFGDEKSAKEQIAVSTGVSPEIGQRNASQDLQRTADTTQLEPDPSWTTGDSSVPQQSVEKNAEGILDQGLSAQASSLANEGPMRSTQPGELQPEPAQTILEDVCEPIAVAQSDLDQVELIRMAKEDGKLLEMQVQQVPSEDGSVTA